MRAPHDLDPGQPLAQPRQHAQRLRVVQHDDVARGVKARRREEAVDERVRLAHAHAHVQRALVRAGRGVEQLARAVDGVVQLLRE